MTLQVAGSRGRDQASRRIGLLYPAPEPLNARTWSGTPHGLATGFADLGYEVIPLGTAMPEAVRLVVAAASRSSSRPGAVQERTRLRRAVATRALARAVRRAGPLDAIVAMGNELFDLRAVRQGKIPVATYDDATLAQMRRHPQSDIALSAFRDRDVRQWSRWQEISLGAADVCCASTSWAVESLVADYGIAGDRARAVGIGHRSRAQSPTAGRDWTKPRLLFVGLDWRRKNGDAVVSAFRQLRRQFPEAELHLVGRHPAIDVPGVNCHGHLRKDDPGDQQRLDELYASATMFVLPSLFEPAGIAYLEAASAGLPVIATTEGGAKDLLPGTAICVPPNDPSALLEAMLRCCDPHTAASIGALGAEFAAGCTWRDVAGGIAAALGAAPPVDQ